MYATSGLYLWMGFLLLAPATLARAGVERPPTARGSESHEFAARPATSPINHSVAAGGSFALEGVSEFLGPESWVAFEKTLSVYENGLLSCQAIVSPLVGVSPRSVTMRYFTYDGAGRLQEERSLDLWTATMAGPIRYGETITYSYNDSGRVTQTVQVGSYRYGFQQSLRISYSYRDLVTIESVLVEGLIDGVWQPQGREVHYMGTSGVPDSIVYEYVNGQTWQPSWKEVFYRPTSDSVVTVVSDYVNNLWQNSMRISRAYDQHGWLIRETYELYNQGFPQLANQTTYSYDQDGVLLASMTSQWGSWTERYEARRTPAPAILLATPTGGERYFSADSVVVRYMGTGENPVALEHSTDNGASWVRYVSGLPDTGSYVYPWVPGADLGQSKLRVVAGSAISEMQGELTILPGREILTHETSSVECDVFSTGYLGGYSPGLYYDANDGLWKGSGYRYHGMPNALFSGGLIVGTGGKYLTGTMYSFSISTLDPVQPFDEFKRQGAFDQVSECTLSQGDTYTALQITQTTSSRLQDDFVAVTYEVSNRSGENLTDFYIGVFADWDIGPFTSNMGGIDSSRGLAFEYDPTGADTNYYGVVALSGMAGAAVTPERPNINFVRSINPFSDPGGADLRTFIASGPFTLEPNDFQEATFALVAGGSLADLQAHADSARALWGIPVVSGVNRVEHPRVFALEQNYPNPFNPSTTIRYGLPSRSHVSLTIYTTLGQQVAKLVQGEQDAGYHEAVFDASDLASGVYLYRLQAGDFVQTKRLLLLK